VIRSHRACREAVAPPAPPWPPGRLRCGIRPSTSPHRLSPGRRYSRAMCGTARQRPHASSVSAGFSLQSSHSAPRTSPVTFVSPRDERLVHRPFAVLTTRRSGPCSSSGHFLAAGIGIAFETRWPLRDAALSWVWPRCRWSGTATSCIRCDSVKGGRAAVAGWALCVALARLCDRDRVRAGHRRRNVARRVAAHGARSRASTTRR
jgi:hypothetical protein